MFNPKGVIIPNVPPFKVTPSQGLQGWGGGVYNHLMKPETLSKELARVAADLATTELPTTRPARVQLLREAVVGQCAEAGYLAQQLVSGMLQGTIPCDRVLHEVCQAALDRWLGKARQYVDVGVDSEFVEWLGRFRAAREDKIESSKRVIEISTSISPPPIVPPREPEEVIYTDPEHPGDLVDSPGTQ